MRLLTSLTCQPAFQLELRRLINRSGPVRPTGREWLIKKRSSNKLHYWWNVKKEKNWKSIYNAHNVTIFQCSFLCSFLSDLKHNCFFFNVFFSSWSKRTFLLFVFFLSQISFDLHIWSVLCFANVLPPRPDSPFQPLCTGEKKRKKKNEFAWKGQVVVTCAVAQKKKN